MKVLFCGRDLHYAYVYTKEELSFDSNVEVVQCDREDTARVLCDEKIDVAVPLLSQLTAPALSKASNLKLIIQYGVGIEGVDISAATSHGIWVSNIPSIHTGNAASCAEMALYLMLGTLRDVKGMQASIQIRQVGVPIGNMLQGCSVLVVGFGNIAKELIKRLIPFGVSIYAIRRKKDRWGNGNGIDTDDDGLARAAEAALEDRGTWPEDTQRLASKADIVVLACHLDSSSRGIFGENFISWCKPGVRVINVARGGLMDYDAVLKGLNSGKIRSMGLDVQFWEPFDPEDPIAMHPQVLLTPHVAGVTKQSYRAMARIVAAEVERVKKGLSPTVQLNAPVKPWRCAVVGG